MNKDWQRGGDQAAAILGPEGLLAARLRGAYEPRPAQLAMARAVARCLEDESKLVVEAGTGTGKTLAYLVPAVLSGRKVVISTGTKTLQEQIFHRDLPALLEVLEAELPVACMKGISNYLCLRRLDEARRCPQLISDPHLERLLRWAGETASGDRAELAELPDSSPLWGEVSPTPETRIGPRCRFFEDCFVTRMRRAAAAAQVVVVNHHLLLADLALRSQHPAATVLPSFEALIIDEAHQLEAIATAFFGQSASSGKLTTLARDQQRAALLHDDPRLDRLARHLAEASAELFYLLEEELPARAACASPSGRATGARQGEGGDASRLRLHEAPLADRLQEPYFTVDAALEATSEHLRLRASGAEDLALLAGRAEELRQALGLFAGPPARGFIFWAEQHRSGLSLHASPVEVGSLLARTLLADPIPVVFTSATLATRELAAAPREGEARRVAPDGPAARSERGPSARGGCAYFRGRVGLAERDDVEELVLPSPFAFERQALLYAPRDLPHPASPEFVLHASERMCQLIDITGGRALCLFTSYRHLQAARSILAAQLDYPLLCQGEAPRSRLLERFRREVASVLLATASFWEGVDVIGESLSLVIIDKLPFAVPSDPLTAARIEALRERGEEPFTAYQLPQAALALRQGFGRLIRHRADRGIVAILDRRLHEKAYGGVLLESLPPCPRTSDLLRVRAFGRELGLSTSAGGPAGARPEPAGDPASVRPAPGAPPPRKAVAPPTRPR